MRRPRAVVVGGGITGLVAAHQLARQGDDVVVLEQAATLGGKIATTTFRGRPLDLGADAFIARNSAAAELCKEVGLGSELIAPAVAGASVAARGRLRPLPAGLALGIPTDLDALAASEAVSQAAVARAALDLSLPGPGYADLVATARAGGHDPTIAEVVEPRLGPEVFTTLVDPLLGGINAGDARALSFAAAAPTLAGRLGCSPSLIASLRPVASAPAAEASPGGEGPRRRVVQMASSPFLGLGRGLTSLIERLGEQLASSGAAIRLRTRLERIRRDAAGGFLLEVAGGPILTADKLVLAVPAGEAGRLVSAIAPALARECAAIDYAGVALVSAAFSRSACGELAPGSGVLVPRNGRWTVTAVTFVSRKWPRSGGSDEVVLRASLGHRGDEAVLERDDEALAGRALEELAGLLGWSAPPLEVLVQRWPASFPQYERGHLARVARIERLCHEIAGLELAGAAYRGIGIPACVADGRRAAAALAAEAAFGSPGVPARR